MTKRGNKVDETLVYPVFFINKQIMSLKKERRLGPSPFDCMSDRLVESGSAACYIRREKVDL